MNPYDKLLRAVFGENLDQEEREPSPLLKEEVDRIK